MKILFLAFGALCLSTGIKAQCTIEGPSALTVGERARFEVTGAAAQCEGCHQWSLSTQNAVAEKPEDIHKTLEISGKSAGGAVLKALVLTASGPVTCEKEINILAAAASPADGAAVGRCDINLDKFREVKNTATTFSLFPNETRTDYRYLWTVSYANGEQMTSDREQPQFPFSETQPVSEIKLKVVSSRCIREFSKSYNEYFWKLF